ncbi:IS4/IS5 family transposase [Candidatus Competibacter phosphatis]|uniref:IS4/IS5 family transposase n=1 Tax=Candidatus Competibacter phosphatis TaxID=221280 RepID=A0ABX1TRD7_9GAMM|nr:IS4/IS5 family transposase [Candidatus Competibacter phosphatis]
MPVRWCCKRLKAHRSTCSRRSPRCGERASSNRGPPQAVGQDRIVVPGWVCAIRKTEEAIRIAHDKIRKEAARKGKQVQPQTLKFAQYVIVFTTFPELTFPASEVLEWYRIRWQVELVFKRFKSLAQLGHLPKYDDESAKAWLYGKLLVALIHHATAISPWGYHLAAISTTQRVA